MQIAPFYTLEHGSENLEPDQKTWRRLEVGSEGAGQMLVHQAWQLSETSSPKILSSSLPRQIGPNYRAGHQLQILIFSLSYKLIKNTCYRLLVFKIVRWSDGDQSKMAVLWNIFIFSLQITRFRHIDQICFDNADNVVCSETN